MPKFEQSQQVKQFADEDIICKQEVYLNTKDECEPWMVINHNGEEFSLSVRNWKSLVELADKVLNQAYPEEAKENLQDDLQS